MSLIVIHPLLGPSYPPYPPSGTWVPGRSYTTPWPSYPPNIPLYPDSVITHNTKRHSGVIHTPGHRLVTAGIPLPACLLSFSLCHHPLPVGYPWKESNASWAIARGAHKKPTYAQMVKVSNRVVSEVSILPSRGNHSHTRKSCTWDYHLTILIIVIYQISTVWSIDPLSPSGRRLEVSSTN